MGRLAHLVNIELVAEISNELQRLVAGESGKLEPPYALEAIISALRLTTGVGSTLKVRHHRTG